MCMNSQWDSTSHARQRVTLKTANTKRWHLDQHYVYWIKPPPATSAFHMGTNLDAGCSSDAVSSLLMTWKSSKIHSKCLDPCHTHGRPRWGSWHLYLVRPKPGNCNWTIIWKIFFSLGSEPAIFFFSSSQSVILPFI